MDNELYDCGIVGGGLAGLSLAIQLANQGYKVVVFEKNSYPFHRVCGEYISKESFEFIQSLGLNLDKIDHETIDKVLISSPSGYSLKRPLDMGGIGISRYFLDNSLMQIAAEKGVLILQNTLVEDIEHLGFGYKIKTQEEKFRVKLAVACSGKRSNLDRKIKDDYHKHRSEYVGVKYHVLSTVEKNIIELHNFEGGYAGISRVEAGVSCLCYLIHSDHLKKYKGNIKQMEQEVLFKNPYLEAYFQQSTFLFTEPLCISQVTFSVKKPVEKELMLLGDAAGTIAPLCGNGMSIAFHSSFIASTHIIAYLEGKESLKNTLFSYEKAWNKAFKRRIFFGAWVQGLFGKTQLTNLVIRVLRRLPLFVDMIIRQTHGEKFGKL